jgi:hypothetical protein
MLRGGPTGVYDVPYELLTNIFHIAIYPTTRTKVIKRVYPLILTCKYFNWICNNELFVSKIIPRDILSKYAHISIQTLIEQYHRPKIIVCSNVSYRDVFIYKIDTLKGFKYTVCGSLLLPPHKTVIIVGKSGDVRDCVDPIPLLEHGKLSIESTGQSGFSWRLIIEPPETNVMEITHTN